jgi:glycosidase
MIIYDFHISKPSRIKYDFNDSFYSLKGNLIITSASNARFISGKINEVRKSEGAYDQLVTPGEINALGILHEIYHYLLNQYGTDENPGVINRGLEFLTSAISKEALDYVLLNFIHEFPPLDVYKGKIKPEEYLNGKTESKNNREIILEELIILFFENSNPAAHRLNELFSDQNLKEISSYSEVINKTEEFFENEKPTGFGGLRLFSLFRKPITTNPYSLEEQLEYIRNEWGLILDEGLIRKLLKGTDLIKEDYKLFVKHGGGEKGTPPVPYYGDEIEELRKAKVSKVPLFETEQFTTDVHWMPEVVMIAKNIFVWLHQLSDKYGYEISTLDQIPDEELDQLAEWNFTALWLIGLWERSNASKQIKQIMGNPEAAASAYSLFEYEVAHELGGEDAFNNLKYRAMQRGIRMASDMVPNHTGIYSKWTIEKPDYFIRTAYPPFHNYSFTGINLSEDDRIEIRIEDKYYSHEDAAVVFQRKDTRTGETVYIYHGNDGTNMPWNDTAQLNMLNPEVRESLYQTIKHVAEKTPIIRFDAAMTLTHKHYQRLWYPAPGEGGAIPSRSDYSMTKEEFYDHIPVEFWREVVDRINTDLPSTLLLAEAFWLMEGYFVRTLGMHRVYNSAFMHMLMKEENDKYRTLIKNTLEFNPEILKRYVNFMSNPDEETAVNQFGKGDKYFGVAVMMLTLPGLPMFAHGQIEGFSEKYGMEYKRAYYDEVVDDHLVWRHKREIFPLMKMRNIFSQVENFELFDFIDNYGNVNENILAFSNRAGSENALVIYNNSYETHEGTIKNSNLKVANGNVQSSKYITEVLKFKNDPRYYYIYTDHRTELEFLISGKVINDEGFQTKLFGYQYRICLNFREVYDDYGNYEKLYHHLKGRGVTSIEEALVELDLIPLHSALEELLAPPNIRRIRNYIFQSEEAEKLIKRKKKKKKRKKVLKKKEETISTSIIDGVSVLIKEIQNLNERKINYERIEKSLKNNLTSAREFYYLWNRYNNRKNVPKWMKEADQFIPLHPDDKNNIAICVYSTLIMFDLILTNGSHEILHNFNSLILSKPLVKIFNHHTSEDVSVKNVQLITSLINFNNELKKKKVLVKWNKKQRSKTKNDQKSILHKLPFSLLLYDNYVSSFLNVNTYETQTYFSKERFEELAYWLNGLIILKLFTSYENTLTKLKSTKSKSKKVINKQGLERILLGEIKKSYITNKDIVQRADNAGYDLTKFVNSLTKTKKKSGIKV